MMMWDHMMYKVLLLFTFASNFSTGITSCAIVLGGIIMLVQGFKSRQWPVIDKRLGVVILIYCIMQWMIAAMSWDPHRSIGEAWAETYRFLPLLFVLIYIKTTKQLRGILIAFIFSVLIDNLGGFHQEFILGIPRPGAFNATATYYACHLLMAIPVLFLAIEKKFMPKWAKYLAVMVLLFTLFMLVACDTRGGWVAFTVMLFVWAFLAHRKYRKKALCCIGVFGILVSILMVVSPAFQTRVVSIVKHQDSSSMQRIYMWQSSMAIICDYPVFGIGQDQFVKAYNLKYILSEAVHSNDGNPLHGFGHPHNNVFKITTEGGIVGLGAFLLLYGYLFLRLCKQYRNEQDRLVISYALMGILVWLGIQVEGITDTNINQVPIMREFWMLMGFFLVAAKIELQAINVGKVFEK